MFEHMLDLGCGAILKNQHRLPLLRCREIAHVICCCISKPETHPVVLVMELFELKHAVCCNTGHGLG